MRHLGERGASFTLEFAAATGEGSVREIEKALQSLLWAGQITNDTFFPLRNLGKKTKRRRPQKVSYAVGEAQHDSVISVHRLHVVAGQSTQSVLDRECPRRVDARSERGQNADTPIAELVAESLDRDIAIRGECIGMFFLLFDVV